MTTDERPLPRASTTAGLARAMHNDDTPLYTEQELRLYARQLWTESPVPRERIVAYLRDGEILARELLAEAEAVNIDRHRRAVLSHDLGFAMGQFHQALSIMHAAIGTIRDMNSDKAASP